VTGGNEFLFEGPSDGVVHALVNGRAYPVVVFTGHYYIGDFEGSEAAEAELNKLSPLVEPVNGLKGFGERNRTVL